MSIDPHAPDALSEPIRLPEWMADAACAEIGGDTWFPEAGEASTAAKRICSTCPVAAECLDYAIANDEKYGIWAGTNHTTRRKIRKAAA